MTLQDLYTLIYDNRLALLLAMFVLPWLALGICIAVPGDREEPLVLNINLALAVLSLFMAAGYVWHATHASGWGRIVQEADILLLLAPLYYVGVSLWVSKQRLPLAEIRTYRIVQGVALIGAGYLGIAWIMSKIRILVLTYMPFQVLTWLVFGLIGVAYLGYLRLTGSDVTPTSNRRSPQAASRTSSPRRTRPNPPSMSVDDELEALRRDLEK
ncbi:hypothetical protein BH23CYA1_BH23CYA1_16830 [soil metagenome]